MSLPALFHAGHVVSKPSVPEVPAQAVEDLGIQSKQDLQDAATDPKRVAEIGAAWKAVKAQSSGITWRYFLMLAGVPENMVGSVNKMPSGRWEARWRTPEGQSRRKVFTRKTDADRFLVNAESAKLTGDYVDPRAGRTTLAEYASTWLEAQTFDMTTRQATELRLRLHVIPVLGKHHLGTLRPSTIPCVSR